jgi:DNA repair protein RecO
MRSRDQAICIRTTDYSETSQVVHFFTRAGGTVHLLAKGAKRPKSSSGGAIDLMSEGQLIYTTSPRLGLGTLIEFSESVSHSSLRKCADRLNTALYMIELVGDMLAEADPHAEVFDLLHNSLSRMAQDDAPLASVLAYFQWRLMRHVGLLGDLAGCVSCNCPIQLPGGKADGDIYFSSLQGGLLCKTCQGAVADKYLLDEPTRQGLAVLLAVEAGRRMPLTDSQARKANRLLAHHISQQLGKRLKMARHVIV